ncbi:thiamine pyrophosphate-binding protein [Paenibacillus pinistramenti]|uniref:thiamine pyrophosphate-binding protein n=1 Tax=Paenibacillus pinistramenti TaxID=1768003 RepID=UPI00110857FA|nr:thiamine pyrophosphate-binding protein [Paenibacillus pinistramenti]
MKAARYVLEYLKNNGVEYIFGIPAGSVNVIFDELYEMPEITPVVTKHEGAASYMAAAYAKYANRLSVCIGCSGPGGTNLVTGAANAMREHLPVLFITGAVPINTVGLNASQELDAAPIFAPVTKYSVRVSESKDVLAEVAKAVQIAVSGVPGPVHVALPIDVQAGQVEHKELPAPAVRKPVVPDAGTIRRVAEELAKRENGIIMAGQGVRGSVAELIELAEMLNWPIVTTPVAKGYLTEDHPLNAGVFGFAGHESASNLINTEVPNQALLVIGSSLGETATNNYNGNLNKGRFTIQMDFDPTVFNRKYPVDIPVLGDISLSLMFLIDELRAMGLSRKEEGELRKVDKPEPHILTDEYNTKNVFTALQNSLPANTRYTVDIGEFMSYVIHYMHVVDSHSFDINVHFGAMGSGISSAIGAKLADPERPVVSLTGDGCFFMHGMEILTAKEYNLPILFVVMNNARLGMVYHGHNLQYKRTHASFDQQETNIAAMAAAMGLPSFRVSSLEDLNDDFLKGFAELSGPAVLEVALKDNSIPPMGDRVKFLSSFGK